MASAQADAGSMAAEGCSAVPPGRSGAGERRLQGQYPSGQSAFSKGVNLSSSRNTLIRSLHDLGAAGWFGGALMGAVALNGASKNISNPFERSKVAAAGWARWAPFSAAAIGANMLGGSGLLLANRHRVRSQPGVGANSAVKAVLTAAALGTTAYSGLLGAKLGKAGDVPADGGTAPSDATPDEVAGIQQRLRLLQWVTPVLTGALVVLGAQQGEQQRPGQRIRGWRHRG
jgi:hypothetical protein